MICGETGIAFIATVLFEQGPVVITINSPNHTQVTRPESGAVTYDHPRSARILSIAGQYGSGHTGIDGE